MPLFKRYEVLLPVRYNDGTTIEEEKFLQTWLEARQQFGGLTIDLHPLRGIWVHEETVYEDELIRLVLDVEDTLESRNWFLRWKETLKERFRQLEIWMVAIPIEVL